MVTLINYNCQNYIYIVGFQDCVIDYSASGITHSLSNHVVLESLLLNVFFPLYMSKERPVPIKQQFYSGKNFGTLRFDSVKTFNGSDVYATGTLYDISGAAQLRVRQKLNRDIDYTCLNNYQPVVSKR